ncbi:MAG: hypothetical protein WA913_11055 [Pricia sp.]
MNKVFLRSISLSILSAMAIVSSCSKDDEITAEQETELSQAEVRTVLEIDEVSSAADNVVRNLFHAEESSKTAKNDGCYQVEYSDTGFTVTFDNCSPEEGSELYDGTLTVAYGKEGDAFAYTIDFDNLTVGDIALDGNRSFAFDGNQDNSIVFEVTSDMTITLPNDSIISEKGNKTFAIVFGEEFGEGMLTLDGNWTLKADGNTYNIVISNLLEADFDCEHIGKGLMLLNKNGLEVSVDFGDGTCDDMAELTYPDGTEKTISLKE